MYARPPRAVLTQQNLGNPNHPKALHPSRVKNCWVALRESCQRGKRDDERRDAHRAGASDAGSRSVRDAPRQFCHERGDHIYGMSDRSKTAGTAAPDTTTDKAARRRAGHRQVRPLPTANPSCDVPLAPPRGAFLWEDLHGYVSTLGTRKNI